MHKKSFIPKAGDFQEKWFLVDAEGQVAGRVAARVAALLRGKFDPRFMPGVDPKIYVVVVNAEKVVLTGKKWDEKMYYRHSGWRGGLKETLARHLNERRPGDILREAVHGMLPKNRLGNLFQTRLRLFAGSEHAHAAQQPEKIELLKVRA